MGEAPLGAASGGARGNRPTARRDCWAAMTRDARRVNEIFSGGALVSRLMKSCVDCRSIGVMSQPKNASPCKLHDRVQRDEFHEREQRQRQTEIRVRELRGVTGEG